MANFTTYTDVEIDLEYDEFLNACSDKEIIKIVKWLEKEGYLLDSKKISTNTQDSIWDNLVTKLIGNRWRLSKEEEETIRKISSNIIE